MSEELAYILPPINASDVNISTEKFGITHAMLFDSSVAENDHDPWNGATAYVATDRVIRAVASVHSIFERRVDGTSATPPEDDEVNWFRVSATNRWKAFDMFSMDPTVGASPMTFVLDPGRIAALAIIGAVGDTVDVTMTSGATTVYPSSPEVLDDTPISDWDDFFFADFALQANVIRLDLPTYTDGRLTITITSSSGTVSVEKIIVGTHKSLGEIDEGARVRRRTFNEPTRDGFGQLTGIPKNNSIPLASFTSVIDKASLRAAVAALALAKSCPSAFIGFDDDEDAFAELLTFVGIVLEHEADLRHGKPVLVVEAEGI